MISVFCQVLPRQPPSPEYSQRAYHTTSRAQTQPSGKAPTGVNDEVEKGTHHNVSPEPQSPMQSVKRWSPRDTPSVESFTQSQMGDDECSEEFEPASQDHPRRASSIYLKNSLMDLKTSHDAGNPVMIRDGAAEVLQGALSVDWYVGSPKENDENNRPRSTTSSNRTPTQRTFHHGSPTAMLPGRPGLVEKAYSGQGIRKRYSKDTHEGQYPASSSPPHSSMPSDVTYNEGNYAATPTNQNALKMSPSQKQFSGDSRNTIRNVTGEENMYESPEKTSAVTSPQNPLLDEQPQAPTRTNVPTTSKTPSVPTDNQSSGTNRLKSSPISLTRTSLNMTRPSDDYCMRGPSIDSLPSRIDFDRPPSPISPYQSINREPTEGRSQTSPIDHGPIHDFVLEDGHNDGNRSQSISRARPSRDMQRTSIHSYPTFNKIDGKPLQSYSRQSSRDHSPLLRQQAPEYRVEGMGSTIEWPSESKTRSRRGSRSSAFFKSLTLGSSSKTDESPLPDPVDLNVSPVNSPTPGEKMSKRASILRSLTGNSGSGSANVSASTQGKENVIPKSSSTEYTGYVQPAPPLPPLQAENDELPSSENSRSVASKSSQRLQKSSTSGKTEQESGKKKRFSGIGVIIGQGIPNASC